MKTIDTTVERVKHSISELIWRLAVAQADRQRAKAGETR